MFFEYLKENPVLTAVLCAALAIIVIVIIALCVKSSKARKPAQRQKTTLLVRQRVPRKQTKCSPRKRINPRLSPKIVRGMNPPNRPNRKRTKRIRRRANPCMTKQPK